MGCLYKLKSQVMSTLPIFKKIQSSSTHFKWNDRVDFTNLFLRSCFAVCFIVNHSVKSWAGNEENREVTHSRLKIDGISDWQSKKDDRFCIFWESIIFHWISQELLVPQKWFTCQNLQNFTRKTSGMFSFKSFKEVISKKWKPLVIICSLKFFSLGTQFSSLVSLSYAKGKRRLKIDSELIIESLALSDNRFWFRNRFLTLVTQCGIKNSWVYMLFFFHRHSHRCSHYNKGPGWFTGVSLSSSITRKAEILS